MLTTIYNTSARGSDALFWPLDTAHIGFVDILAGKTPTHIVRNKPRGIT